MAGSAMPQPESSRFFMPISRVGSTPAHLITTAASLRLGHLLRRRFISHRLHLGLLVQSSVKDVCHENFRRLKGVDILHQSEVAVLGARSYCMTFFSAEGSGNNSRNIGKSDSGTSRTRRNLFSGRGLTNILLIVNVLVYIAQIGTQGKLLLWGAKVNCYSLNSIGPTVESISGPRRYLAVYITSAVASSAMSYWLSKAPAVGASGAIFGLVGSFAVFILRHGGLVGGGKEDLQHITHVVVLNMVIGLMSKGIDNWGHLGGLLGGAATSWLLGPAWRYESLSSDGQKIFSDRAPIFSLVHSKRRH